MANPCEHILECRQCQDHELDCIVKEGSSLQVRVKELTEYAEKRDIRVGDLVKENAKLRKIVDAAMAIKGILDQFPDV